VSTILAVDHLSKSFGAVTVADEINFSINEGAAIGILGPNGAGKSSLFNLITGALDADFGDITFEGKSIVDLGAAERCRLGIARAFQVPHPFVGMTVFENVLVGAFQGAGMKGQIAEKYALEVLDLTGLLPKANIKAGVLNLLDRKRLEMARALAAKPKLLLLDEIAGGLTEAECSTLIDTIKAVQKSGTTILWIEHVVHALLAVVDKIIVIDFGRKVAEGEPNAIMASAEVKEIYLGIDPDV
jgi:branched-chain amino acid transport system ATP-binding protein